MKVTCSKCAVDLKTIKVGVGLVETFDKPPKPYKLFAGDLLACPGCGFEVVVRTGSQWPIAEHWHADFADRIARAAKAGQLYYSHEKVQPADEVRDEVYATPGNEKGNG